MSQRVQLNQPAPDFTLLDFNGRTVRLADFRGRKNVLLVFNRGFTWPFCRGHMAQLRQGYPQFVDRDTEVVVVGPENARAFSDYWQKEGLPFIGLPDPDGGVLKTYGQEVNLFKLGRMSLTRAGWRATPIMDTPCPTSQVTRKFSTCWMSWSGRTTRRRRTVYPCWATRIAGATLRRNTTREDARWLIALRYPGDNFFVWVLRQC
jgi:peroxiredoxin